MLVNMLCLREKERRLSAAELAAARPMVGRLSLDVGHERWDTRRGERQRTALLYDPMATRSLAELHRVRILKITARGMVLAGVEEVFARRAKERAVYRQAWWCWPAGPTNDCTPAVEQDEWHEETEEEALRQALVHP
jgi:hypothetical protein